MDTQRVRARLVELRDLLDARHHRIEKHLNRREEPLPADSEERAGELGNHETMARLDEGARAELLLIDRALARLDAGDYGRCERCGEAIADERLDVIPFAVRCVACADGA